MQGPPRILPAASSLSLRDQIEDLVGGHAVAIPVPEWLGDRHGAVVVAHPQIAFPSRANALAGRVLGAPAHGPCVLARRVADESAGYRAERPGERFALPFDDAQARAVLADLGREIEEMHDA